MDIDNFFYPSNFYPYFKKNKSIHIISPFQDQQLYNTIYALISESKTLWIVSNQNHYPYEQFIQNISSDSKPIEFLTDLHACNIKIDKHNYIINLNKILAQQTARTYPWDFIVLDLIKLDLKTLSSEKIQIIENIIKLPVNTIILSSSNQIFKYINLKCQSINNNLSRFGSTNIDLTYSSSIYEKVNQVQKISKKGKGIILVSTKENGEFLEVYLNTNNIQAKYLSKDYNKEKISYYLDSFESDSHFEANYILISSDVDVYIHSYVDWVVLFNDYLENNQTLQTLSYYQKKNENLKIHLLKSYEDEILLERTIDNHLPDKKCVNILFSNLIQSASYQNHRFITLKNLYNELRYPKVKINNSLKLLEKLKIIESKLSLMDKVFIIPASQYKKQKIDTQLSSLLNEAFYIDGFSLLTYCQKEKLSPLQINKEIIQLNNDGIIEIIIAEKVISLSINQKAYKQQDLGRKSINKHFDINLLKRGHSSFTEFYPITKSLPKEKKNPLSILTWIQFKIIEAVKELPYPIGKHLLADILIGSSSKKILKLKLFKFDCYKSLDFINKKAVINITEELILNQYLLSQSCERRLSGKVLHLSHKALKFIKDKEFLKKQMWLEHQKVFTNSKKSMYPQLKSLLKEKVRDQFLRYSALYKMNSLEEVRYLKGIKELEITELINILNSINNNESNIEIDHTVQSIEKFYDEEYFPVMQQKDDFCLGHYSDIMNFKKRYSKVGLIIHRYKYKNSDTLPEWLVEKTFKLLTQNELLRKVDYIITVPGHEKYPSITGKLAVRISEGISIEYLKNGILKKDKYFEQKSMESLNEKKRNAKGKFIVSPGINVNQKAILLLDDIYDSGSTIEECKNMLIQAGASKVYSLCCAKTTYRH